MKRAAHHARLLEVATWLAAASACTEHHLASGQHTATDGTSSPSSGADSSETLSAVDAGNVEADRKPLGMFADWPRACQSAASTSRGIRFSEQPSVPTGIAEQVPYSAQAAYFDDDSLIDIVLYNSSSNSDVAGASSLLVLDGRSGFKNIRDPVEWPSLGGDGPGQLDELLAVDVNHDGTFDVGGMTSFALTASNGDLGTREVIGDPNGLRLWGDMNGDGQLDYVFGRRNGDLEVSLGTTWPNFNDPIHSPNPLPEGISAIPVLFEQVIDVTGDGNADLLGFRVDGPIDEDHVASLMVQPGDGAGHFAEPETEPFTTGPMLDAAFGDFNCDGLMDWVISTQAETSSLTVLLRKQNGWDVRTAGLSEPAFSNDSSDEPLRVVFRLLAVGDFNADGAHDVVVNSTYFRGATKAASLEVLAGGGSGEFDAPVVLAADRTWTALSVADLNADDSDDVYLGASENGLGQSQNGVSIWLAQGDAP